MALPQTILNIPGAQQNTASASNIVGQLLSGQPGTSRTRSANAYFGAGSGIPGSEFIRNRGFDLYNKEGDERQQRGLQDLLAMISGYTGPALQERGQNNQASQFAQSLKQRQDEFNQQMNLELKKFGFNKNRYGGGSVEENQYPPDLIRGTINDNAGWPGY